MKYVARGTRWEAQVEQVDAVNWAYRYRSGGLWNEAIVSGMNAAQGEATAKVQCAHALGEAGLLGPDEIIDWRPVRQ